MRIVLRETGDVQVWIAAKNLRFRVYNGVFQYRVLGDEVWQNLANFLEYQGDMTALKEAAEQAAQTATQKASEASASAEIAAEKANEANQSAISANNALSQIYAVGYQGAYNPVTNTPALSSITNIGLDDGAWYEISASGTLGFATTEYSSGQAVNIGDILRKKGTQLELRLLAQNTSKIASWIAQSYLAGSQVNYNGEDWINNSNAINTDVPGISSVWQRRLTKYAANKTIGKNLFDKSNASMIASGFGVGTDGNLYGSATMGSIKNIPVVAGQTYTISGITDPQGIGYFNAQGVRISGASMGGATTFTFTAPANCAYIAFRVWGFSQGVNSYNTVQVELGSIATSYEGYTEKITGIGGVTIKNADKEVYSTAEVDTKTAIKKVTKNLFDKSNSAIFQTGKGIGNDGNPFDSAAFGRAWRVPIEPNKVCVISGCPALRGIRFETADNTLISFIGTIANGTAFTTPANCTKISFQIYGNSENNANAVQLEYGSSATAYESYNLRVTEIQGVPIKNADKEVFAKEEIPAQVSAGVNASLTKLIQIGKNLFDKSNSAIFQTGKGIGNDGNPFDSAAFGRAWRVPIEPNKVCVISGCPALRGIRFETADNTLISFIGTIANGTAFTTPANCTKISFQIYGNSENNANAVQLEYGSSATAYESYTQKEFVQKINGVELLGTQNTTDLVDFEVISPKDIYFVDSGSSGGREEPVHVYVQRFIRDKLNVSFDGLDRFCFSNISANTQNLVTTAISYVLTGIGFVKKAITTNRQSVLKTVLENQFPKVEYLGDSILADRQINGQYVGGGSMWSFPKEISLKNRYDNGNTGYNYLCVGRSGGINSAFSYKGQTMYVRGFANGFGGWTTHSFLRHPFRFWVSSPAGAWDLLGLRTTQGRAYSGTTADKVLIMKTCYGVNTPSITADSYALLVAESQISNLGAWTGSTPQVDAVNEWISGIANETITPQNPYFDITKTGTNRFNYAKYLSRYKTLADDGTTRLVIGSTAGSKVTDINATDVCTPSHFIVATGENDRLFCSDYVAIADDIIELMNEVKTQLPSCFVGFASTQMPHPMFPERYPDYVGRFSQDDHNRKYDFYKEISNRFGTIAQQASDRKFIIPTWHCGTPASGSTTTYQTDESRPNFILQVAADDYNHPGYFANRTAGTQIYGWVAYTYILN